jgi:hypothetical protein
VTAIDEAPDCTCGDPRTEHKRGTGGCRNPECGCGKYVASGVGGIVESIGPFDPGNGCVLQVSSVLDVGALLAEVQGDADREAELAARLAEAERGAAEVAMELAALQLRHAREVRELRERIAELEVLLEHAEQHARDLQDDGVVLPADGVLIDTTARHCPPCGWTSSHERHPHPTVPVRVIVHKTGAPTA